MIDVAPEGIVACEIEDDSRLDDSSLLVLASEVLSDDVLLLEESELTLLPSSLEVGSANALERKEVTRSLTDEA